MKTTSIMSTVALLFASQSMASPTPEPADSNILIATTNFYACNCPNNCDYGPGSTCKFYDGPSNTAPIFEGFCSIKDNGPLLCG